MTAPIKAGDRCRVIAGLGQHKSPNLGLKVTVGAVRGEHSRFGRVWRCTGAGVKQLNDAGGYDETGWADFPAAWLQKIDPVPLQGEYRRVGEVTSLSVNGKTVAGRGVLYVKS